MVAPSRAPRRTQAERRRTTETRLLAATADLIAEKGITGTTLAEIGQRAGYSRGIVNHHFGTKTALVQRLIASVVETLAVQIGDVGPDVTGLDAILTLGDRYLELVVPDRSVIRAYLLMWASGPTLPADLRAVEVASDDRFRHGLVELIERGRTDGTIRGDIDPVTAAVAIVGMLRGAVLQLWIDPDAADPRALAETIRSMLSLSLGIRTVRPPRSGRGPERGS